MKLNLGGLLSLYAKVVTSKDSKYGCPYRIYNSNIKVAHPINWCKSYSSICIHSVTA